MTKKQLIKELEKFPDNIQIICSSDPEGNCFSKLYSAEHWETEEIGIENVKYKNVIVLFPE